MTDWLSPDEWRAVALSLRVSTVATLVSLPFGILVALALAREDAGPIVHGLRHMPELAPDDGWAHFLRNHDEWSLDKLTEAERQEVFASFGPDPSMQLFGRGLRRRMPTMLKGNPDRLRMAYALMASMPGVAQEDGAR
ncbi:hypothetical protein LZ190_23850, partial [Rhodovulum sulfidophilum]|nr:hypothetical protein [Rhodovulum sulfidophilum]